MYAKRICIGLLSMTAAALIGCGAPREDVPPAPSPMESLEALLALHGVLGRSLDERPEAFKKAPVERKALTKWVLDYTEQDPFLADLYVGFVVGVTAANQHSMEIAVRGSRAEVKTGRAKIVLYLRGNIWRVSLSESIPAEIKARAMQEKLRVAENAPPPGR